MARAIVLRSRPARSRQEAALGETFLRKSQAKARHYIKSEAGSGVGYMTSRCYVNPGKQLFNKEG